MLVLMEITSFAMDPVRNTPLIILKETGGNRTLSIPINPADASAIAIKSLNVVTDRPMTIDLVRLVMDAMGGKLDRAVIDDAGDRGMTAKLHVVAGSNVNVIECAMSDAISLALRCNAAIFATDRVLEKGSPGEQVSPQEALRRTIAGIDTLDFGRYYVE